jgi:hypothetical protein
LAWHTPRAETPCPFSPTSQPLGIAKCDKVLSVLFYPEAVPRDFATRGGGLLALRPGHFIAACTDLAAIPDDLPEMAQRYATMQLPVSILYGRADGILSPRDQGEALAAKMPGARLTLIEGGHMLPLTQLDRTAQFTNRCAKHRSHYAMFDAAQAVLLAGVFIGVYPRLISPCRFLPTANRAVPCSSRSAPDTTAVADCTGRSFSFTPP